MPQCNDWVTLNQHNVHKHAVMIAEKVARDPVRTVADLSREAGILRGTGGNVTFVGTLDHHQNVSIGGRVIKELGW